MAIPVIRRARTGYLFVAAVVGHLILISAQVNTRTGVPLLQTAVFGTLAEVQRVATAVVVAGRDVWAGYVALRRVHAENEVLRRRVDDLSVSLQQERAAASEADGLRRLLGLRDRVTFATRGAEIVGGSAAPDSRALTVGVGTMGGIRVDMAVIAPDGVVGRVMFAGLSVAKVQLLIDRNAAAAAIVERTRAQGIVLGSGESELRFEYLSPTAELTEGDRVVTSGYDGIYPRGVVIGTIDRVERTGGVLRRVTVTPAVDFSTLEHVLIVTERTPGAGPAGPTQGQK